MALYDNGVVLYEGAVIGTTERYWLDGMVSEYATVWDMEKHCFDSIRIGYYGSDGHDFIGIRAEVEVSTEVARDIIRTMKREAWSCFSKSVLDKKNAIEAGIQAEVIRGRKIPKGTKLDVFWVGERPTYTGYGTELIAGCKDCNGKKVWIKSEYLKNITPLKSPSAAERRKFIKAYVKRASGGLVLRAAMA